MSLPTGDDTYWDTGVFTYWIGLFLFFFLAIPCNLHDLILLTWAPAVEVPSPNDWTAREFRRLLQEINFLVGQHVIRRLAKETHRMTSKPSHL